MSIVILGVDLGKNACSIVGVDATGAVVLRRTAATTPLRWQQRPDHFPLFVRNANPLAQGCLQKPALNQGPSPQSSFVHET